MARTTPGSVISDYIARAQEAINCLTPHVLVRGRDAANIADGRVQLARGSAVRLGRGRELTVAFRLVALHSDSGGWTTRLAGYRYSFSTQAGREFLAFHWHPDGASHVKTPHAHILIGSPEERALLGSGHIPTPELSVRELVRFAVEDLGVPPIREDWRRILAD